MTTRNVIPSSQDYYTHHLQNPTIIPTITLTKWSRFFVYYFKSFPEILASFLEGFLTPFLLNFISVRKNAIFSKVKQQYVYRACKSSIPNLLTLCPLLLLQCGKWAICTFATIMPKKILLASPSIIFFARITKNRAKFARSTFLRVLIPQQ